VLQQVLELQNPNGHPSQDFEAAYDIYDSYLADDFTFTETTEIEMIFVDGLGTLDQGNQYFFSIYADDGGHPIGTPNGFGLPEWSTSVTAADAQVTLDGGNIYFQPTVPISIDAGTWWFVFYVNMDYDVGGQWFWEIADSSNGMIAQFVNPLDGFGSGATTWTDIQTALTSTGHDLAFGFFGAGCGDPADEICTGGDDEDFDGLTDCVDGECVFFADCLTDTYAETDDTGNNEVQWDWADADITWVGPGTAEATGLTLASGSSYLISGSVVDNGEAAVSVNDDHDTFAFNTGDATDLMIALDLEGTGNDCDVVITSTTAFYLVGPGQVANGSSDILDGIYEELWIVSEEGDPLSAGTNYYITVGAFSQLGTTYPADYELYILAL
jgi:hypothetical protein